MAPTAKMAAKQCRQASTTAAGPSTMRAARQSEDPRAPERVRHTLAEMIRYRALLIAAGYPDGNDCDLLKSDPAFKMAVGRLPQSGANLCSQPTISRLENLPGPTALKRMMAAMVEVFCDSFAEVAAFTRLGCLQLFRRRQQLQHWRGLGGLAGCQNQRRRHDGSGE